VAIRDAVTGVAVAAGGKRLDATATATAAAADVGLGERAAAALSAAAAAAAKHAGKDSAGKSEGTLLPPLAASLLRVSQGGSRSVRGTLDDGTASLRSKLFAMNGSHISLHNGSHPEDKHLSIRNYRGSKIGGTIRLAERTQKVWGMRSTMTTTGDNMLTATGQRERRRYFAEQVRIGKLAHFMHVPFTIYSPFIHVVFTLHLRFIHVLSTSHSPFIHVVFTFIHVSFNSYSLRGTGAHRQGCEAKRTRRAVAG
jgi:hypothetical protein